MYKRQPYYTITIGLAIAEDWKIRILNQGFREKKDGKLTPIQINGKDVAQPRLLDNAGKALPEDGTPVELEKDIYGEVNYLSLFGITA